MSTNIKRNAKGTLVLFIIFLILGTINLLLNIFNSRIFHYKNVIVGYIPSLIFFILLLSRCKYVNNKSLFIALNTILSLLFFILILANLFVTAFLDSTTPIDNISYYNKILRLYNYPKNKFVSHFPSKIPKNATDITFWETPQFLQGANEIQLSYKLPEDEIKKIDSGKYNLISSQIITDEKQLDGLNNAACIDNVLKKSLGIEKGNYSSKNFKIFIIDNKPSENNNSNHGYNYGIAINKDNDKILYWFEHW